MYGTAVRYYTPVLSLETLEQMKEDIIEALTKIVFNERLSHLALAFCKVCTKDEERVFAMKINELQKLKPGHIGLN